MRAFALFLLPTTALANEPAPSEPAGSEPESSQPDGDAPESDEDPPASGHDHDDPFPDHADDDMAIIEVVGKPLEPPRGAGDVRIAIQETQALHASDPESCLSLTPGLVLTRNGGEGAPMRILLRGFDARHGQDVAFSLDGLPLNQVGHPHGHGLVDLRLAPAEAMSALEVHPGPTAPDQGDFAVAGSIDVELGLAEPGLVLGVTGGSFGTARGVLGWRDPEEKGTFLIGELYRTDGYGDNRGGQRGTLVGRLTRGDARITAGVAASAFDIAGLVRRVDVEEGRIDLYGTQDERQGSGNATAWAVASARGETEGTAWSLAASLARRTGFIRSNFTGFLQDDRRPGESPHDQRGDLLDQRLGATTAHMEARVRRTLSEPGADVVVAAEAGARGRVDEVDAVSLRLRDLDGQPYRTEVDGSLGQADAALHGGLLVEAPGWTLRAGGRAQGYWTQWNDRCAALDAWFPGVETDDVNCPDEDRNGPRRRDGFRSAAGLALAPRVSGMAQIGPSNRILAGGGRGFRSVEAVALSEGERAPFGDLWSADLGWQNLKDGENLYTVNKLVAWATQVRRDLVFNEDVGTNVAAGSSTRMGATWTSEAHAGPLRQHTSITGTYAVFGKDLPESYTRYRFDRQPGQLVPYVPPLVVRSDWSYTWRARSIGLRHGAAVTYLSPRPLPLSAWSEPALTVDLGTEVRWRWLEVGISATNVLNARYPLAEYNFASWFPDASGTGFPTRLPARQISPGAPRAVLVNLVLHPESR